MFKSISKVCFISIFLSLPFLLAGCVTTLDRPKPVVDEEKVLESNVKLGMAYLQQKQRDSALRAFNRALEVDSKSAEANMGLAIIHQLNGELDLAEKSFKKAERGRVIFSEANIAYTYGRFLMEGERYKEALSKFETAGKDIAFARRADAIYSMGVCADKLSDNKKAIASFEHALNLNTRHAPAALELAHQRFEARQYEQAKTYLDIYSRNARQSARSLWLGIRIERIFGNKDKEASYALALKNLHPYSREYLMYKELKN